MKKFGMLFAMAVLASACGGGGSDLSTADLETECVKIAEKSDAAQLALESGEGDIKVGMADVLASQQDFFDAMSRWEETTDPDGFTDLKAVMGEMAVIIDEVSMDSPEEFAAEVGPKIDELMEEWEGKLDDGSEPEDWVSEAGRNSLPDVCVNLMEVIL